MNFILSFITFLFCLQLSSASKINFNAKISLHDKIVVPANAIVTLDLENDGTANKCDFSIGGVNFNFRDDNTGGAWSSDSNAKEKTFKLNADNTKLIITKENEAKEITLTTAISESTFEILTVANGQCKITILSVKDKADEAPLEMIKFDFSGTQTHCSQFALKSDVSEYKEYQRFKIAWNFKFLKLADNTACPKDNAIAKLGELIQVKPDQSLKSGSKIIKDKDFSDFEIGIPVGENPNNNQKHFFQIGYVVNKKFLYAFGNVVNNADKMHLTNVDVSHPVAEGEGMISVTGDKCGVMIESIEFENALIHPFGDHPITKIM
jgi:hypothetical protein